MPAYANRSRAALLAMASPLVAATRALLSSPAALDAARAVEEAALALDLEVSGRRAATSRLSAEVAAAIAREDSLDRRVAGLHRALDGLRAMGLGAAEDLLERLFPAGLGGPASPAGLSGLGLHRLAFLAWRETGERRSDAEQRPLAVALLADGEQRRFGIGHDHAHEPVARTELDATDTARVAAHRPHV